MKLHMKCSLAELNAKEIFPFLQSHCCLSINVFNADKMVLLHNFFRDPHYQMDYNYQVVTYGNHFPFLLLCLKFDVTVSIGNRKSRHQTSKRTENDVFIILLSNHHLLYVNPRFHALRVQVFVELVFNIFGVLVV